MTPDTAFLRGIDAFGAVVHAVPADAWDAPSPCAGWAALDVLGHVVRILDVGAVILSGEQPDWAEPPGRPAAVLGTAEPGARWDAAAAQAREAMVDVDLDRVVDSPRGPRPIGEGLSFPAIDLHVHAWDLGTAVGVDVALDPDLPAFAHAVIDPMPEEMKRSPGVFGPEVSVGDDASDTDRFLAWTGRTPR
jgi:uncharacterized protein (TIGR03086 family)